MTAIVTGNGLGLFNASNNILGSAGILGQGWLGQALGRSYVNAATGNLILQGLDESLSGRGADLTLLRTYNSRGTLSGSELDPDVDGNRWHWDAERTIQFSGTAAQRNLSGTVTRTGSDGHVTVYQWVSSTTGYVSTEGNGAHDTVKYDSVANEWVWTDGTTRLQERYSDSVGNAVSRLQSQVDVSGNRIRFSYDGSGRLTEITDDILVGGQPRGQKIKLIYNGSALERVETYELNVDSNGKVIEPAVLGNPVKQVEYVYDNGRIGTVKVILNPGGGTAQYFTTTYTYQSATSSLITNVAQSDGTSVAITYDDSGRVRTITDGNGKQTFDYFSDHTDITISAADGSNPQTWTYTYDAGKQLIKIESPTVNGARLTTTFTYESESDGARHSGNLKTITQVLPGGTNRTITYKYDDRGNRVREYDSLGDTISRTYDAGTNQLLTETHYKSADTNVNDDTLPSDAMTVHYVYDSQSRLRFVVSADGRVAESRYYTSGNGMIERLVAYTSNRYSAPDFTEGALAGWVAGTVTDKSQIELTTYAYDFRGNLSSSTRYAKSNATTGEGVMDAAATLTEYVYDGHGQLLKTIAVRGSARDQRTEQTSFLYDGLGRETQRITASGTQTTKYNGVGYTGGANTIQVTTAAGLTELSTFDSVGRLTSLSRSGSGQTRETKYFYDAQGRLALTIDPQGGRRFSFYDAAGRLAFQVDAQGEVTGFTYDSSGRVLTQTHYENVITSTNAWLDNPNNPTKVTKTSFVVATAAGNGVDLVSNADKDRSISFEYDAAGRLHTRIDATGVVTTLDYDGTSRLTQQQNGDRVTRYFYDADGKQVGVVDPLGYLTESKYDAAGRLIETVRYTTRSPNAPNVAAPTWSGVIDQVAVGNQLFYYRVPVFDADGDALAYSIVDGKPDWLSLDTNTGVLSGTPPVPVTTYTVRLRATDARGRAGDIVTVRIDVKNSAPTWADIPDTAVPVNTSGYQLKLPAARDTQTAPGQLIYSIDPALLPPGLSFDPATLTISGKPTTPGIYTITASVTDVADGNSLTTQRTFVLTVTNSGPRFTASVPEPPQVSKSKVLTFTIPEAIDPEGEAITYTLLSGPAWLSLNGRTLSGTAPVVGLQAVVIQASDPNGAVTLLSFSVMVKNDPPTWSSQAYFIGWLSHGQPFSQTILNSSLASDPNGDPLTYTAIGLPPGLTVRRVDTGLVVEGTTSFTGAFTAILRATDTGGLFVDRPLEGVFTNEGPTRQGEIGVVFPPQGDPIGGDFVVVAFGLITDPNNDTLTYEVSQVGSPSAWLDFDDSKAFITGTAPRVKKLSSYNFVATATDPYGLSVSFTFHVTVRPDDTKQDPSADLAAADAAPVAAADPLAGWRPTNTDALHGYRYYDAQGHLIGSVDERGFLTETAFKETVNEQQNITYLNAVSVGASDTLTTLRDRALLNSGKSETIKTAFDALGRVSTITGVDGTITHNYYDDAGRLIRQVYAEGQVEADGITSAQRGRRTRYDAFGEVTGTLGGVGDAWLVAHTDKTVDDAIAQFGMRYAYDSAGRRTKATDANGHITLYYYDSEDQLRYSVNAKGEVSETQYNSFGQVKSQRRYSVRVASGALGTLQQSGGGPLTPALDTQFTNLRDDAHDELTTFDYDKRGLLTQTRDGEGYVTTNTYNSYGLLATQIRTILQAQGGSSAVTSTTRFDYDLDGQLISTTRDVGGLSVNMQTAYDAYGRVIRTVDAVGKVMTTDYLDGGRRIQMTDPLNRKVLTEYDAYGRTLKVYDAVQMAIGDANQRKPTIYAYDNVTRTIKVTTPEGVEVTTVKTRAGETFKVTDGRQQATRYAYDQDGRLLKITDALGNTAVDNHYDDSGRLETTQDAHNTITKFTYDEVNRIVTRQVDPDGLNLRTVYELDAFGQQITVTEADGTAAQATTIYRYDLDGRRKTIIVDPSGLALKTTFRFDGLGNVLQVSQGTVSNPDQQVTLYVFDNLGRRIKEIKAPSAIFGSGTARTRDLTTEYRYDAAGRVSRRIDASGQSTWFVYDDAGQLKQTIDALGEVTEHSYDLDGRIVHTRRYRNTVDTIWFGDVVAPATLFATGADQRSYFVYDGDGRQRFAVRAFARDFWVASENRFDANGNLVETRTYDSFIPDGTIAASDTDGAGLTVAEMKAVLTGLGYQEQALGSGSTNNATLAGIERTRYAYDADNRLRFTVDAMDGVSENVYDAAGNILTQIRFAVVPSLGAYDEQTIDAAVNRGDADNRISQFAYDAAGRLRFTAKEVKAASGSAAAQWVVTEQVYDGLSRVVKTIAYDTKLTSTVNYNDPIAMANALTASAQDRIGAVVYDAAGRQIYSVRASTVTANRQNMKYVITRQTYDALGHVIQTTAYADIPTLADLSKATVDAAVAGNSNPQNRTTRFAYDAAGRMRFTVAADGSLREAIYDALGQVAESRQFDLLVSASTQITEAALVALRGGRVVGDGSTRGERYTYDRVGRLLTTTDAANHTEISTYDAFGNRETFIDKNGAALLKQHQNDNPPFNIDRVRWSYSYDRLGRVVDEYSPLAKFQLSNEAQPPTELRQLRTHYVRDAFGNLTAKGDALDTIDQRITAYQYDKLNRQTMVTLPGYYDTATHRVLAGPANGGTSFARTLETTYDTFGNAVRTKLRTGIGANDFQYEYQTYDVLNRLVHDIDALGNLTLYSYTAFDEQKQVTRASMSIGTAPPDGVGGLWTVASANAVYGTDPLARPIDISYDNLGRKINVTQSTTSRYYRPGDAPAVNPPTVADATGQPVAHYDYNAFGDLVHEAVAIDTAGTDAFGRSGHWRDTSHYFDVMGREVVTVDALGYQTVRTFDKLGNLSNVVEYANAGSPASPVAAQPPSVPSVHATDRITSFEYDALGRQLRVLRSNVRYTDLQGTKYVNHDVGRDASVIVKSFTYDDVGHLRTSTDALGNVTTTSYDVFGRREQAIEPQRFVANAVDPFKNQILASPVTTFTYDAFGQVVAQVRSATAGGAPPLTRRQSYDFSGNAISSQDANGAVTHFEYDFAGRVIRETQAIVASAADLELIDGQLYTGAPVGGFVSRFNQTIERRYAYDALGHRTDAVQFYTDVIWGNDSDTRLDNNTQVVRKQSGQRSVYNAFGEVMEELKTWGDADTALNQLNKAVVATYTYDRAGFIVAKHAGDGVTQYYYDLTGHVTRQEQRNDTTTSDGSVDRITETRYDALGRAKVQVLPAFTANLRVIVDYEQKLLTPFVQQAFDRWNNVVSRSQFGFVFNDNGLVWTPLQVTTTYEYNHENKVIAEHLPEQIAYFENSTPRLLGVTHQLRYDLLGRAVQEDDIADDAQTGAVETILLRGDKGGRRREYDAAGRLTAQVDATDVRVEYAYDVFGNRVGTRNAMGTVFVDDLDNNGNVVTHSVLRLGTGAPYDSRNSAQTPVKVTLNRRKYDQAGRLIFSADFVNDPKQTITQYVTFTQYDERNSVRQVGLAERTDHLRQVVFDHTYGYDQFGNKSFEVEAGGFLVGPAENWGSGEQTWTYNSGDYTVGRLDNHAVNGRVTTYTYNDFGQVWTQTTGNDTRVLGYHSNGLLATATEHQEMFGTPGGPVFKDKTATYGYDVLGQMVKETFNVTVSHDGGTSSNHRDTLTFYDELGRVTLVRQPGVNMPVQNVQYAYDPLGNRRRIKGQYTNGDGKGVSDLWYTYDEEGRVRIVDGHLNPFTGVITADAVNGAGGTLVEYDEAGRRSKSTAYEFHVAGVRYEGFDFYEWYQYRREEYTYNDLGYLGLVEQTVDRRHVIKSNAPDFDFDITGDLVTKEIRTYDTTGRMTGDTIKGDAEATGIGGEDIDNLPGQRVVTNIYSGARGQLDSATIKEGGNGPTNDTKLSYGYLWNGLIVNYQSHSTRTTADGKVKTDSVYNYAYSPEAQGLREREVTADVTITVDDQPPKKLPKGITTNYYDPDGNLFWRTVDDGQATKFTDFEYDLAGHVLFEGSSRNYVYAQGHEVASVGPGYASFTNGFTPISEAYPGAIPGNYVVSDGDTLASIAKSVWGDASLWYLLADANNVSFGPNDPLPASEIGRTYHIPNVVANVHSNAGTFKPYNPAEIIGSALPTPQLPQAPSDACEEAKTFLIQSVIVSSELFVRYGTQAVLMYYEVPAPVAAAIGAAAGNVTRQSLEITLTDKEWKDFNGWDVAEASASAAATSGISEYVGDGAGFQLLGQMADMGIHYAFHSDDEFHWEDAAARSLTTAAGSGLSGLDVGYFKFGQQLGNLAYNGLNPRTGWAWNDESRNWRTLVSQAIDSSAQVTAGGVSEWGKRKLAEQARARAPAGNGPTFLDSVRTLYPDAQFAAASDSSTADHDRIVDMDPELGHAGSGVFNFPYLTLSPEGLNAAEFMRNHSIYRVSAADGSSEDVGGHATGFRFEGEWLARYNGRNGLNLSAGNILLVPRYVPVLEAGYVQREEFGREQTLFDQLENQRIAAANARYFQQQAEMAADLAVAGLPDMPAGYFEMLQQMPPDQMQRIIASPSFGGTVAVTDSRRIEGVAFARQATYLLGSDTEIDAAISANPHAEVIFVHPESRSTAEMSRVNGLDNVATLEQFAAIRALNGAPLQGGQLWKEFLDYRGMKSDEIDREYALIDGYATLATTGSQLILGTGAGLMAPVPYLASIFAGMGTDYAVTKITGNADAGLIAGMAAGFLAGGLMARAMPADTLVGRGLQLWQPGGTEGRLSIAYKPGLPGHNKVGIQMKGGNGTQWADLIYSEEFKELSANGAFQAAQLAAGGQPAHINLATGISPKYQITTVPVTRTQGEAVLQYFLDKASNPGTYSMVGNSCSSFCVGALDAAGVQSPRWTPTPGLLFNWAKGM